jgi:hypothetical protein
MIRTLILAGLLYGHYATGYVGFLYGAFAVLHIVQESIVGVIKTGYEGGVRAVQQLRKQAQGGALRHDKRENETKID